MEIDGRQLHHQRFGDEVARITPRVSKMERMLTYFVSAFGVVDSLNNSTGNTIMEGKCASGDHYSSGLFLSYSLRGLRMFSCVK